MRKPGDFESALIMFVSFTLECQVRNNRDSAVLFAAEPHGPEPCPKTQLVLDNYSRGESWRDLWVDSVF